MSVLNKKQSNELVSLRDAMSHLVDDSFYLPRTLVDLWTGDQMVPLDMYEENNNLVVKASLPAGIKPEDVNIEVKENVLTISGETKEEVTRKESTYLLNERRFGQFRRSVPLPYEVKVEKAEAEFENGTLILTLPKAVTAHAKKISVKPKVVKVVEK